MDKSVSEKEYIRRIYKAQDYIEQHLHEPLPLEVLAEVSGFSKYHFHRIFKTITHESLAHYVNRLKLERSLKLLAHYNDLSVTNIAHYYGFTDAAVFSRTFKKQYGISPIQYRQKYSKNCKASYNISQYNEEVSKKDMVDEQVHGSFERVELAEMAVIYARYTGTYKKLAEAFPILLDKLYRYASLNQLLEAEQTKLFTLYHDHPEFTSAHQLRVSLCVSVPRYVEVDTADELGSMLIASGMYVVGHFELFPHQYSAAWDIIYDKWLIGSGYKPRDAQPFEVYVNNPNEHPEQKHLVDIYLPIELL